MKINGMLPWVSAVLSGPIGDIVISFSSAPMTPVVHFVLFPVQFQFNGLVIWLSKFAHLVGIFLLCFPSSPPSPHPQKQNIWNGPYMCIGKSFPFYFISLLDFCIFMFKLDGEMSGSLFMKYIGSQKSLSSYPNPDEHNRRVRDGSHAGLWSWKEWTFLTFGFVVFLDKPFSLFRGNVEGNHIQWFRGYSWLYT